MAGVARWTHTGWWLELYAIWMRRSSHIPDALNAVALEEYLRETLLALTKRRLVN
jgi:hypothetical protein